MGGPPIRLHQRLTTCWLGACRPPQPELVSQSTSQGAAPTTKLCVQRHFKEHHVAGLSTVYRTPSEPSCTRKPVQVLIVTCQHYIQQHSSSPPGYPCSKGQTRVLVNNTQHTTHHSSDHTSYRQVQANELAASTATSQEAACSILLARPGKRVGTGSLTASGQRLQRQPAC